MATPEETTALKRQESPRLTTQSEGAPPNSENNVDFGSFAMASRAPSIKPRNEHHTKTLDGNLNANGLRSRMWELRDFVNKYKQDVISYKKHG
ncbi:hypothetical protein TNCV_1851381 [Trichonephila clavipes]|nr:hypothetical protein TNCV_1851381 [Trichonephila clavipes]